MPEITRKIFCGNFDDSSSEEEEEEYYLEYEVQELPDEQICKFDEEQHDNSPPIELTNIKSTKSQRRLIQKTGSTTVYINKNRRAKSSGIQRRDPNLIDNFKPKRKQRTTDSFIRPPKKFAIIIKYHYPLLNFPSALEHELREIQNFFSIGSRGEGSVPYRGNMVSLISYRVSLPSEQARLFTQTIVEVLYRYGVEVYTHDVIRIQ